ncbi:hypothetical protein CROQUDRAFT_55504 [Cronartium quercuum f. sp. fusiforme G11]|uniref:Uncharacterized protein n=1 Tax=Cronartium quercuum f. sp. fusiforme G11 TaxID=708437 RepID=A0A9P6T4Z8_9BASI|nr:hypothetical protein CROQUDRAFT_55504 [Cronartium quercuum f. sp. fusiforme G11]
MSTEEGQLLHIEESNEEVILIHEIYCKLKNINKYNQEVDELEFDGTNLSTWKSETETAVFLMMNVSDYWDSKGPAKDSMVELAIDKCTLHIIYSTINKKLRELTRKCKYAHDTVVCKSC